MEVGAKIAEIWTDADRDGWEGLGETLAFVHLTSGSKI